MIEALHSFFIVDARARWRALLWSWAIGTGAGAVLSFSDASHQLLASVSIGSSTIAFVFFLAAYISSPLSERIKGRRPLLNLAYAASALAVFAVVERFLNGPQAVYAAANELAKDMRTGKTISTAYALVIQERARSMLVTGQLHGISRSRLTSAYAIAKAASQYSVVKVNPTLHPLNTNVITAGQRAEFVYQPSLPIAMFGNVCHIGFANVNFTARVKGCALFDVTPGCQDTVVASSLIRDFTQDLDDIVWIDVIFERCALTYRGGHLTLTNVVLKDCTVAVSPTASPSIREALLQAAAPITTTSEFPS